MGNVASRLDSIVEQVSLVLQDNTSVEFQERIQDTESVICLCRYPHDNVTKQNEDSSVKRKDRYCDHALRFYLPMEQCIFYVQTERGPLSFDAGPHNIVVTVGKQLQVISFLFHTSQLSISSFLSVKFVVLKTYFKNSVFFLYDLITHDTIDSVLPYKGYFLLFT